jgi:hypothetical protein
MKPMWIAALALVTGTGALAEGTTADQAKAEKKVCRSERVTGSLARVNKICMTQAEWDRLGRETKKDLDDIQRNAGAVPRSQAGTGATAGTG